MLAYVFWHRPHTADGYEAALERFHAGLRNNPPPGFVSSWWSRIPPMPWLPAAPPGQVSLIEDWYMVEDFTALGELNDAAVTQTVREHDEVAALSGFGTAGLYRLVAGDPVPGTSEWSATPPAEGNVWRRVMVLGPAPEYCRQRVR